MNKIDKLFLIIKNILNLKNVFLTKRNSKTKQIWRVGVGAGLARRVAQ